ncbi:DUF4231 domain-containing protein [Micromonospora musae]|uniref:DUF4231 domain-containing protein n=1 Tax=Micromonospora musae TaxID=1894970 RepID=A0ABX9QYS3_9ACTN|nr:DUF4231 domain-containing protein [Micromonospora musae]RKN15786.1 DUF4231 domain-containing protein [Micromonospora musae]
MADVDAPTAVDAVWQQQGVWSRAAGRAQGRIIRGRRAVAGLTIAAAVAGTAAAQLGGVQAGVSRVLAVLAAVALALVPVAARATGREAVQAWTRLRSVSEALKADVYRHLARVAPFSGPERDVVLLRRLDALVDDVGDLVGLTVDLPLLRRQLPTVAGVDSYLTHRLVQQVEAYYLPGARQMARRAARIRLATTALTVVGAVLSGVVGVLGDGLGLAAWVGVVATVTTALVGYGAAQQFEAHQIEYARTADQLTRLGRLRRDGAGWSDDDAFVAEAERIISVSNEAWMARTLEEDGTAHR